MDVLTISWESVVKVILGVGVAYVLAPLLLVLRSYLVLKVIEKVILTKNLRVDVDLCEFARYQLDNVYSNKQAKKHSKFDRASRQTVYIYKIDNEEVSWLDFENYESDYQATIEQFNYYNSKVTSRSNLVNWLTVHFQQKEFENPINGWRQNAQKRASEKYESRDNLDA